MKTKHFFYSLTLLAPVILAVVAYFKLAIPKGLLYVLVPISLMIGILLIMISAITITIFIFTLLDIINLKWDKPFREVIEVFWPEFKSGLQRHLPFN